MKGGMKLVDSRPIATFYKVNWDTTSDPKSWKSVTMYYEVEI